MSTQHTERTGTEDTGGGTEPDRLASAGWLRSIVERHGGTGTVAVLAGGALLAGAVWTARRRKSRAGILALVGGSLLFAGLRRRRSAGGSGARGDGPAPSSAGPSGAVGGEGEPSADAGAHRDRSDVLGQPEANPRGVSGEPDVETRTDPDEGDVRFTSEQDEATGPKPGLEGTAEEDPRRPDTGDPGTPDDHVEVDLSEAAMADEASEATGPDPEQAYPSMEGTDPEPTSPAAPDTDAERSEPDEGAELDERKDVDEETPGAEARETQDDEARGTGDETREADDESGDDDAGAT